MTPARAALRDGTFDATNRYSAVGCVPGAIDVEAPGGDLCASGTLISPNIFMTSAHFGDPDPAVPRAGVVRFGPSVGVGDTFDQVAVVDCFYMSLGGPRNCREGLPNDSTAGEARAFPPDQCPAGEPKFWVLQRRVTSDAPSGIAVTPIPLALENPDGSFGPAYWDGRAITDVGYGGTGRPRVVRRFVSARGYSTGPVTSVCGVGAGPATLLESAMGTTARVESGDSGGPILGMYPSSGVRSASDRVIGQHAFGGAAGGGIAASAVHVEWVAVARAFLDPDGDGYHRGELDAHVPGNVDDDGDGLSETGDGGPTNNDNCTPAQSLGGASTANRDQLDSDGDGIGDVCDVCPRNYDPDQEPCTDRTTGAPVGRRCGTDIDGDTVRDECDNCPTDSNPMQTDTDPTTPTGDACDPDADGDGIRDRIDNCPNVFNVDQSANCNVDTETVVRGDACDTSPCPVTNDRSREVLTGVDSVLFANDIVVGRGVAGVEPGVFVAEGTAATMFRWCPCAAATDDSVATRLLCDTATVRCRRFAAARAADGSNWQAMRLAFGPGERFDTPAPEMDPELVLNYTSPERSLDPAFTASQSFDAVWDFVADAAPIPGAIETDARGHESVRAVIWSRATRYLPTPPPIPGLDTFPPLECSAAGTCPPVLAEDPSSGFWSGRVERREARLPDPSPPPFVRVLIPREQCAICVSTFPRGYLPMPQCLVDGCGDPEVWIRVRGGDLDVTPAFSAAARRAMLQSGWQWISPAEPFEILAPSAPRLVAWDPVSRRVMESLVERGGVLQPLRQGPNDGPPFPDGPPIGLRAAAAGNSSSAAPTSQRAVLLRGNSATLVLLGSGDARLPSTGYEIVSAATSMTRVVPLAGEAPRMVLAAQLAARTEAALVLDETRGHGPHRARLLWVDLDRRRSSVLAAFPRLGVFDRHGIAATPDGDFVLVASSRARRGHVVLHLRASATGLSVRGWASGSGTLAGTVDASRMGISFPIDPGRGRPWTMIGYSMSELREASIDRLRDCM